MAAGACARNDRQDSSVEVVPSALSYLIAIALPQLSRTISPAAIVYSSDQMNWTVGCILLVVWGTFHLAEAWHGTSQA